MRTLLLRARPDAAHSIAGPRQRLQQIVQRYPGVVESYPSELGSGDSFGLTDAAYVTLRTLQKRSTNPQTRKQAAAILNAAVDINASVLPVAFGAAAGAIVVSILTIRLDNLPDSAVFVAGAAVGALIGRVKYKRIVERFASGIERLADELPK